MRLIDKLTDAVTELFKLQKDRHVLEWLRSHPGWHFGLEIVEAGVSGRGWIYVILARLEERGLVERMEGAKTNPGPPRPLYRAVEVKP